ncbi:MAG: signal peptide peptidase SppA [Planctomycetota bacterium]|nr:signal peptide peptidase SppA [Planctomycetota bacterium]
MSQPFDPDSGQGKAGQPYVVSQARPPLDAGQGMPPPPPPPGGPYYAPAYAPPPPPRRQGVLSRIVAGLVTTVVVSSLAMNVWLSVLLASQLRGPNETTYTAGDSTRRVVILPISGAIDDSTASFIHEAVRLLKEKPPAAIVLRVDSPGGGVSASDRIWHELTEYRKAHKDVPIVASFGSVAASGGYYVSALADHIVAEPTTITGSIGVIAQAFTVEKLLEKVGVTPEVITSSEATKKDSLSPFHAWSDADRKELRNILDQAHSRFTNIVFQGRNGKITEEEAKTLANGGVLTCAEAREAKLVDEEGYLDQAIIRAQVLAKINTGPTPEVTMMAKPRSLGLLGALQSDAPSPQSLQPDQVRRLLADLSSVKLEYRWAH